MGVSLAVAGIRTAVSATRQSQINAGVRGLRKEIENFTLIREKKCLGSTVNEGSCRNLGKYKRERERGMVMKEKRERRKKYSLC